MSKHLKTFKNEPFTNYENEENKNELLKELEKVKNNLSKDYPLIINGEEIYTDKKIVSLNPGNTNEVVGRVSVADKELVEKAHLSAQKAFESWKKVPAEKRADYLFKVADLMRKRKHEFTAWMIFEAGKSWGEADADTAEAIDFLEYYAKQMLDMANPEPLTEIDTNVDSVKYNPLPLEKTKLNYIPLGVGVVIPPWNFPVAILTGVVGSAIVTGNTALLKPSELTSVLGYKVVKLFEEVGLPKGVINYIPGYGSEIGDYLVDHSKTRFISFTGSREVGCRIFERAAKVQDGQIWLKRVIAEMGGKDGVVVDETADLERAANAIVGSAFGFQGQKCSAGSRAIIVESVYEEVVKRVIQKTKALKIGNQIENYEVGPVSDEKAFDKIMNYIEIGKKEGELVVGGNRADDSGYYIEPTIFTDVKSDARIFKEEIFGPVLAITKAKDYKEAIQLYNDTEYGLTGAYHSTNEERIKEALEDMHCGNLYINKKCTGALVGVNPFGGFNMSGTDSKAGGPDYLIHFTQPKMTSRLVD